MIKNIITDMGNVLLRFDPEVSLNEFCSTEESKNIIRKELFNGPEWIEGDLGIIKNGDRYEKVRYRVPEKYRSELKECVAHWDICMTPIEGAKEFFANMKAAGYAIYVLSNACSKFYEYFPRYYDLAFFDGIVVSSDIHIIKPDERIYKYLLDKYRLTASECLFIDDVQKNVDGAEAVGINGFLFRGNFDEIKF